MAGLRGPLLESLFLTTQCKERAVLQKVTPFPAVGIPLGWAAQTGLHYAPLPAMNKDRTVSKDQGGAHILGRPKLPIWVLHFFGDPTDFIHRKTDTFWGGTPGCCRTTDTFWPILAKMGLFNAFSVCPGAHPAVIFGPFGHFPLESCETGWGPFSECAPAPGAHPGPGAAAGEPPSSPFRRGQMSNFAKKNSPTPTVLATGPS
jgi:hypothetical protein